MYQIRSYEAAFITRLHILTLAITLQRVAIPIRVVLGKLFTSYDIAKYLYRIRLLTNNLPINCTILPRYAILVRYISFLTTHFAKCTIIFKKSKSLYDIVDLSLYRTAILNRLLLYYLCVIINCDTLLIIFRYLLLLYLPYNLIKII